MKKRKIGVLALSLAVASAICVPTAAFAANAWDPAVSLDTPPENVTSADTGANTTLKGVIKPTTLSVSVPTAVTFSVDPGETPSFTGAPTSTTVGQFVSPSNYTITNKSRVPIYAAVTAVTTGSGSGLKAVSLTGDPSALTAGTETNPAVMVGLNDKGNSDGTTGTLLSLDYSAATPTATGTWLNTSIAPGSPYYAFHQDDATTPNKTVLGKLAAGKSSTGADVTDGTNSTTMYVYGAVKGEGWNANDAFTVTPTFTIKTVAFA